MRFVLVPALALVAASATLVASVLAFVFAIAAITTLGAAAMAFLATRPFVFPLATMSDLVPTSAVGTPRMLLAVPSASPFVPGDLTPGTVFTVSCFLAPWPAIAFTAPCLLAPWPALVSTAPCLLAPWPALAARFASS